jgi:2,4-dienoyl-CoA reductase-like NADH-dependent reductase (Old Yellow Enzyme family)
LFEAVARRLDELKVSWIEMREPHRTTSGGVEPTEPVSPTMRKHYSGRIFINADSHWEDARALVERGEIDGVSIGRHFLANPDLVRRIELGTPLNEPDTKTFYKGGAQGYVDYPTLDQAKAA